MRISIQIGMFFLCLFFCTGSVFAGFPDTGQTACYDGNQKIDPCTQEMGQDGNYSIISPSYSRLGPDGSVLPDSAVLGEWVMVRDNVSGLIWEVKSDDDSQQDKDKKYSWFAATAQYLDDLNAGTGFGGFTDWRLPNRLELQSIADYSRNNPAIHTDYFPHTKTDYPYWSSDAVAGNTNNAWAFVFYDGSVTNYSKFTPYYVRAVRGAPIMQPVYQVQAAGTVTDIRTGLMWELKTDDDSVHDKDNTYAWNDALNIFIPQLNTENSVGYAGYQDWRLPNIKELASIMDLSRKNPALSTDIFPYLDTTTIAMFWTSTTDTLNAAKAWYISINGGDFSVTNTKTGIFGTLSVMAVRGGQPGTYVVKGDLDADGYVTLSDAVIALKICAGMDDSGFSSPFPLSEISADGDEVIGMGEAVFALQKTGGLRW